MPEIVRCRDFRYSHLERKYIAMLIRFMTRIGIALTGREKMPKTIEKKILPEYFKTVRSHDKRLSFGRTIPIIRSGTDSGSGNGTENATPGTWWSG